MPLFDISKRLACSNAQNFAPLDLSIMDIACHESIDDFPLQRRLLSLRDCLSILRGTSSPRGSVLGKV